MEPRSTIACYEALQAWNIILASGSPRRLHILQQVGCKVVQAKINIDESFPEDLPKSEIAEFLALKKMNHVVLLHTAKPTDIVITADTTVIFKDSLLEKPKSKGEAKKWLTSLSGNTHLVITGVCMRDDARQISFSEETKVSFYPIPEQAIDHYLDSCDVMDKAGGYGLQDWIGTTFVRRISGSYDNVVGLPGARIAHELHHWK